MRDAQRVRLVNLSEKALTRQHIARNNQATRQFPRLVRTAQDLGITIVTYAGRCSHSHGYTKPIYSLKYLTTRPRGQQRGGNEPCC